MVWERDNTHVNAQAHSLTSKTKCRPENKTAECQEVNEQGSRVESGKRLSKTVTLGDREGDRDGDGQAFEGLK